MKLITAIQKVSKFLKLVPQDIKQQALSRLSLEKLTNAVRKTPGFCRRHKIMTLFAASAAIQMAPDLAREDLDDYLKENGYNPAILEAYQDENIHVYGRYNPLSSLHYIGSPLTSAFQTDEDENWLDIINGLAVSPFKMAFTTAKEAVHYASIPWSDGVNAFMSRVGDNVHIRPPGDFEVAGFIKAISNGLENMATDKDLATENDPQALARVLRDFVMAHELAHTHHDVADRYVWPNSSSRETYADEVAASMISRITENKSLADEAIRIVKAARTIGSLGDETSHDTDIHLFGKQSDRLNAFSTLAAISHVSEVTSYLSEVLTLPENIGDQETKYHIIKALADGGYLMPHPLAHQYAQAFTESFEYLNDLSNGSLIEYNHDEIPFRLDFLNMPISSGGLYKGDGKSISQQQPAKPASNDTPVTSLYDNAMS